MGIDRLNIVLICFLFFLFLSKVIFQFFKCRYYNIYIGIWKIKYKEKRWQVVQEAQEYHNANTSHNRKNKHK